MFGGWGAGVPARGHCKSGQVLSMPHPHPQCVGCSARPPSIPHTPRHSAIKAQAHERQRTRVRNRYLLGEAGPQRVLGVAEGRALKHGRRQLQDLLQQLVKLGEYHQSVRVRYLRENICKKI